MTYYINPIAFKPPRLIGLSEDLLVSHYEAVYGLAVRRLNAVEESLAALDWSTVAGFELARLKHEEVDAANSMVLHEAYFDCLGGQDGLGSPAIDPIGPLAEAICRDFGGLAAWREQFMAIAKTLDAGTGWVVLSWSMRSQQLQIQVAADHRQIGAEAPVVLALDMVAHAYEMDFGSDVAAYIEAFMANLHWGRPTQRFLAAQALSSGQRDPTAQSDSISPLAPEALRRMISAGQTPVILDICLPADLVKRHDQLPGALCWQSDRVAQSMASLSKDQPIVAYCMYGFQVSANAAHELRLQGYQARMLAGGISAWRAIGGATVPYRP